MQQTQLEYWDSFYLVQIMGKQLESPDIGSDFVCFGNLKKFVFPMLNWHKAMGSFLFAKLLRLQKTCNEKSPSVIVTQFGCATIILLYKQRTVIQKHVFVQVEFIKIIKQCLALTESKHPI